MRILIADDYPLLLAGVRSVLELDGGFEIVGATEHGPEILPLVDQLEPDVVLFDVQMPGLDGLACLGRIRERHPDVRVVVCSVSSDPEDVQEAFRRGASGYIVKNVEPRDLASAIRQAIDGTAFHARGLPAIDDEHVAREAGLTKRELEILRAVSRGLSNKAIAKELWIAEPTVKFHLNNIYRKLGISNRTEAARWLLGKGLLSEDSLPSDALV